MELNRLSALQMLQGLRQRDFSAVELAEAHIRQLTAVNPKLNAMTHERFEQGICEAKQADALRHSMESDSVPLLCGIPMTMKEMYDMAGFTTTGGVPKQANRTARADAAVVKRVRDAGAIILAKTNTSTLTMAHETDNLLFGRTNHPLSADRTPGGSSGGEAALISSFASPWGVGSDLGGSIRLPAHLCGIVGFRPTFGRIPTDGEYPAVPHHGHMNSAGPLARRVEDVVLLYQVLSQHMVESVSIKDIRMTWLPEIPGAPLDEFMEQGLSRIVSHLEHETGQPVREANGAFLQTATSLWQDIILQDRGDYMLRQIQETESFHFWSELIFGVLGRRRRYHRWMLQLLLGGKLFYPRPKRVEQLAGEVEKLRNAFCKATGPGGVLLTPVFPTTAPKHGKITSMVYTNRGGKILPYLVFVNAMGYPSITVPVGTSPDGYPYGIQIVGGQGEESRVLEVARWVERIAESS